MALLRITLQDFVIVQHLELDLQSGFSVLTGETGAGKSILLDALQLAMGARADTQFIREGCTRADISAEFDCPPALQAVLDEAGILATEDNSILLRRVIENTGKSRGWVNGTPVTATQLRQFGSYLLDIHGQHAWQSLMQASSMRQLLDAYGRINTHTVQALWQQWQTARERLEAATQGAEQRQQERERLQWQISEIDKVAPQPDEWENLNTEHQRLAHAQQLLDAAHRALQTLEADGGGVLSQVYQANHALQEQLHIEPAFTNLTELLTSAEAQLQEVQHALQTYLHRTELDPDRLQQLDQRLGAWLSSARRFKIAPDQLATQWESWQQQLQQLDAAEDLAGLQQAASAAEAAYAAEAQTLTLARQQAARALSSAITAAMQDLGMAGGQFVADVGVLPQAGPYGVDAVDFLVAGHAGTSPRPVAKVASGGELSRIALAIAVTTSKLGAAPTLIFDEVDAGIGGVVAHTVGKLMQQLGTDRQVLAVTHLAQVAAAAHHHLHVAKQVQNGHTTSHTRLLNEEERIEELARMLGGNPDATTSLAHARAMYQEFAP